MTTSRKLTFAFVCLTLLLADGHGLSLDLGRLQVPNLFGSLHHHHSSSSGLGVRSKFGHLFSGVGYFGSAKKSNCQTIYDDVCEEKCRTVYKDKCKTTTVSECSVITAVECHEKLEQECNYVFEDRCTTLQVPYCNVKLEENCSFEPECHVRRERQCTQLPKKVCKQVTDNEIEHEYPEPSEDEILEPLNECNQTEDVPRCREKRSVTAVDHLINTVSAKQAVLEGKKALLTAIREAKVQHEQIPVVHVAPVEVKTVCHETFEERCEEVPREICQDVRKCHQMPKKICGFTPRKQCIKFPTKKCVDVPRQICHDVPKKSCKNVPKETCLPFPEKVCEKVYVKRPREVCYPVDEDAKNAW